MMDVEPRVPAEKYPLRAKRSFPISPDWKECSKEHARVFAANRGRVIRVRDGCLEVLFNDFVPSGSQGGVFQVALQSQEGGLDREEATEECINLILGHFPAVVERA